MRSNEFFCEMVNFVKSSAIKMRVNPNDISQGSANENQVIPTPKYHIAKLYRILLYPYQKCR
jgi:hypothetical protein